MIAQFETILEPLKHPKVKIVNKAFRKQRQLFEPENDTDVQFNGYNSLSEYQEHMNRNFLKSKDVIQQNMTSRIHQPFELKQNLHLLKFEIKSFRKSYFQLTNDELILSRIELVKNSLPLKHCDSLVKQKTLQYITVEHNFLEGLERLIKHRINHLDQFYLLRNPPPSREELPTSKELSAYLSGQLSLFPKDSGITLLQWNRNKVDFIELFTAVHESNSVIAKDKRKLTKKEFLQLLMWFFNIQIGHWEGTLAAAKNRKMDNESPYIKELASTFTRYTTNRIK